MTEKLPMAQVQMGSGCQSARALLSVCVSVFCCLQLQLPCLFFYSSVDVSCTLALGFCFLFFFLFFLARIITFYAELFDEGGSLEGGACRFSRALSRFMLSCLTRVVR
jgi:hypothetical protein